MNEMQTMDVQQAGDEQRIQPVEEALDKIIAGKPTKNETVRSYVKRCCEHLDEKAERILLSRAILQTFDEAGINPGDNARDMQKILSEIDESNT